MFAPHDDGAAQGDTMTEAEIRAKVIALMAEVDRKYPRVDVDHLILLDQKSSDLGADLLRLIGKEGTFQTVSTYSPSVEDYGLTEDDEAVFDTVEDELGIGTKFWWIITDRSDSNYDPTIHGLAIWLRSWMGYW